MQLTKEKKIEVGGNAGFNWDHYALKTNETVYLLLHFNSTVQNLEEKNPKINNNRGPKLQPFARVGTLYSRDTDSELPRPVTLFYSTAGNL